MTSCTTAQRPGLDRAMDVPVTGRRIVATIIDGLVFGAMYTALAGLFGTLTATRTTGTTGPPAPQSR